MGRASMRETQLGDCGKLTLEDIRGLERAVTAEGLHGNDRMVTVSRPS